MILHLLELRRLTLQTLIGFMLLFLLLYGFADALFQLVFSPLLRSLVGKESLIATQITTPVFTPIKLAANSAMLLIIPVILLQIWRFMRPGLYKRERVFLAQALGFSLCLFFAGVLFCFYAVLPFMFQFFAHSLPKNVQFMPDLAYALDFITWMVLVFGFCFQVPLLCIVLVRLHWISLETLRKIRPYVIVSAFIVGMLLTPPDVFSQIMLAVPLCLLYESGIFLASFFSYKEDQLKGG